MPSPLGTPANATPYVPDNTPAPAQNKAGILDGIAKLLAPLRADYVDPTDTPENAAKTYSNLTDLSKSALNSMAFGLPRAINENLDPSTVDDWKKTTESEAGRNGNNIGTLLSSAVPIPGLAGVGLVRGGAGIGKQIIGGGINAGINSAGQQGIRELASAAAATPEGRDPTINGENIMSAGLAGVGLGALFHGIVGAVAAKGSKASLSATQAERDASQKLAGGQLLGPGDSLPLPTQKVANAYLNKISGGQNGAIADTLSRKTPMGQAAAFDNQVANTAWVGHKYGITGEGNTAKQIGDAELAIKGKLNQIDAIAQDHLPAIKQMVSSDDALKAAIKTADTIPNPTVRGKIQAQIGAVQSNMAQASTAGEMRTILKNGMETMSNQVANDATLRPGLQALKDVRDTFNDSLSDIMVKTRNSDLSLAPREYGVLQDIGKMSVLKQGSDLAAQGLPQPVENALGMVTAHPLTLAKRAFIPGARKIDKLVEKSFPESLNMAANAHVPGVGVPAAAPGASPAQPVINAMSKKDEKNGSNATPGTLQTDLYDQNHKPTPAMVKMLGAIEDRFQTRMQGYSQMNVNGQENDFTKAARASLASKLFDADGNPNMQALGQFMFEGGPDQEAYNKAINAYNQMMPNIREAYESSHGVGQVPIVGGIVSNTPGLSQGNVALSNFISTMTPNQNAPKSARNAVIEGLQRFTGSPKDEQNANEAIVNSSSPSDLEKRLLGSMKSSNSIGYGLLKQIGLVP